MDHVSQHKKELFRIALFHAMRRAKVVFLMLTFLALFLISLLGKSDSSYLFLMLFVILGPELLYLLLKQFKRAKKMKSSFPLLQVKFPFSVDRYYSHIVCLVITITMLVILQFSMPIASRSSNPWVFYCPLMLILSYLTSLFIFKLMISKAISIILLHKTE